MQFTYYTEKSVAQALTAINERLQAKGGRDLDGWIDKNGEFSLSINAKVGNAFNRRTTLRGKIERVSGQTVITGGVSDGVPNEGRILVFVALGLVGLMFLSSGNPLFALAVIPVGLTLYVMMKGDHDNSAILTREIQRALNAKTTPIKKDAKTNGSSAASVSTPKPVAKPTGKSAVTARPKSGSSVKTPAKPKP